MEAFFVVFVEWPQLATRTIFELYFLRVMKQFKFQRHRLCSSGSERNVAKLRAKGKSVGQASGNCQCGVVPAVVPAAQNFST